MEEYDGMHVELPKLNSAKFLGVNPEHRAVQGLN